MTEEQCEKRIQEAIIVMRQEMNRLRGRLYGTIESWGRPERQERACIGTAKMVTFDAQTAIESALRGFNPGDGTRP